MAGRGSMIKRETEDEWSTGLNSDFNKKMSLEVGASNGEASNGFGGGGFGSSRGGGFGANRGGGGFGASSDNSNDDAHNGDSAGSSSRGGFGSRGGFSGGRGGFGSDSQNEESGGFGSRGGFGGGRGGGGRGGGSSVCFKCNESGHFSRECPNADSQERRGGGGGFGGGRGGSSSVCFKCNESGHFARECPNVDAQDSGARPNSRGGFGGGRGAFGSSRGDDTDCGDSRRGGFGGRGRVRGGFDASGNDKADGGTGSGGFGSRGGGGFGARGGGRGGFGASNGDGDDGSSGGGFGSRGGGFGGRGGGRGRGGFDRGGADAGEGGGGSGVCYKCDESGHFARECPNADARTCFRCKLPGHLSADCPSALSGEAGGVSTAHVPEEAPVDEIYQRTIHAGINFSKYEKIDVEVSGSDKPGYLTSFEGIGLPSVMLENILRKYGYGTLTPVQKYGIPIILKGRDLMACAQTGSGKTAAFLLPLAKMISEMDLSESTTAQYTTYPLALIVSPTRELCIQTYNFARGFIAGTKLSVKRVYGGPKTEYMRGELGNGCHILVATPGRLKDFAERNIISLKKTRFLVLDEADQMLDRGFLDSVTWTLDQMPSERQILMFSATFAGQIQALAGQYLQNYLYLTVGKVGAANPDVAQEIREVQQEDKQMALISTLAEWRADPSRINDRIIVFVETKRQADFIGMMLAERQFPCTTIHGDRLQREREIAISAFQRGKLPILVATNVSARGVDISGIELVINMDLPNDFDMYVHRIGRTGRCGNTGKSISFYDHGRDSALAFDIRQSLVKSNQYVPDWLDIYADQCGGGLGSARAGVNRDTRRCVARDRYREETNDGDFADSVFRPAPHAAAVVAAVEEDDWD